MKEAILEINNFLDEMGEGIMNRYAKVYGEREARELWENENKMIGIYFATHFITRWLMHRLIWRKFVRKVKGLFSKR